MPYQSIEDLPKGVKDNLPKHAKEIFLKAFNNAWKEYRLPEKRRHHESQDTVARRVAWAAVEKQYRKDEASGRWVKSKD